MRDLLLSPSAYVRPKGTEGAEVPIIRRDERERERERERGPRPKGEEGLMTREPGSPVQMSPLEMPKTTRRKCSR